MTSMDDVRNPIYAAEPYQESQGRDSPNAASPDALMAFYKDMEQKETMERKLSKRRSNSIWSRKSVKRSTAPADAPVQKQQSQLNLLSEAQDQQRRGEEEREMERLEEQRDTVPQALNSPRSIIPDSAKDLPAWYNKETWSSPLLAFKLKYNVHNPVGPRWYQNHHLIPPSHVKPATRPPSVFSPSFPPMASSTSQDRSEDATRMPGPSRTPSNSPLPTPNSSQTRVEDSGAKPRSRKTSQTAHDNVDLLDVTDPWGTNWHHQSPYDIGLSNGQISVDVQDAQTRTRRSSMTTAQSRRKTVTPSPLSQSTSAVHLHVLDVGNHLPRKLSKRRMPVLGSIFGGETQQPDRNAVSLPVTPVEHNLTPDPSVLPKRSSMAHINDLHTHPSGATPKKEKRGSVLGRLVKKFSILRKPTADQRRVIGREDDWQHVGTDDATQQRFVTGGQVSSEKEQIDSTKRIPPPLLSDAPTVKDNGIAPDVDRSSSISFEAPFSIGRLTITNPDAPGSSDNTPTQGAVPLLPDKSEIRERGRLSLQTIQGNSGPVDSDMHIPSSGPSQTSANSARLSLETQPPVVPDKSPPPASLPPISANREMGSSEAPAVIMSISSSRFSSPDLPPPQPQKPKAASTTPAHSHNNVNQPAFDLQSLETRSKTHPIPFDDLSQKPVSSPRFLPSGDAASHPTLESTSTSASPSLPFHETTDPEFPSADSPASCNYSPLSTISMLANPPTPYTADLSMPPSPEPPPSPLPPTTSRDRNRPPREPSPASNIGRQTETFKLVRSSSSNVYASNETIVAGGQQWEVVESADKSKGRASSKVNDRETGSRRDQRREGRQTVDMKAEVEDRHRNRSHRSYKPPPGEYAAPNSISPMVEHLNERSGLSRGVRKKEDGSRTSDRKRSTNLDVNKPQPPPPPPPTPGAPPTRQLERQPSTSARPTSELPSAAEMNALRAKEAWDLERLYKARSVYGNDSHAFTSTTVPLATRDEKGAQADSHGSSHTAFVVQSPFQSQPSHIYHSMPTIPTPIVYSSTSVGNASQQFPSSHYQSRKHSSQSFDQRAASTSRIALSNPLPVPPRASTYEPTPLSF